VHRYFDKVALVRLQEPTSRAGEDIVKMLEAMARFLPRDEGRFGIHLALAEIYQATGQLELAQMHIEQALSMKPARFNPKRGPASGAYQRLGLDQ
jgi:lipoprotein NlpI